MKVRKQWKQLSSGAENCVHVHGFSVSACHSCTTRIFLLLLPSGLVSKVVLLYRDSENVQACTALSYTTDLFGKHGCKLCFYILIECFT